ncbi:peptidase P60 [Notoacmeibacter sp. MSK16QG-6]|uniref:peptidase P60 n=1 Tax=Notoacmeibacter sp. MSK16QG-6 TaxID=2957982 RepID=UPI0020A05B95|nr:peptidase P60 [Notoacmeibacter sp. MSK16QG-6]MCP1198125.1 peptidase P60 [Notoacmeibacter sp. MSK16QG-6]
MNDPLTSAVVDEARRWIGTPYRHQQSRLGVGCDCLGLVRGIWRAIYGCEPEQAGPYAPFEDSLNAGGASGERLLEAAARNLEPVETDRAVEAGQVLVFRWRPVLPARHLGIATEPHRFIHAYSGIGVVESALVPSWRRRIAGRFRFPGPAATGN